MLLLISPVYIYPLGAYRPCINALPLRLTSMCKAGVESSCPNPLNGITHCLECAIRDARRNTALSRSYTLPILFHETLYKLVAILHIQQEVLALYHSF